MFITNHANKRLLQRTKITPLEFRKILEEKRFLPYHQTSTRTYGLVYDYNKDSHCVAVCSASNEVVVTILPTESKVEHGREVRYIRHKKKIHTFSPDQLQIAVMFERYGQETWG
jgi:hypothetical protein